MGNRRSCPRALRGLGRFIRFVSEARFDGPLFWFCVEAGERVGAWTVTFPVPVHRDRRNGARCSRGRNLDSSETKWIEAAGPLLLAR
jgi:hypothetical protein